MRPGSPVLIMQKHDTLFEWGDVHVEGGLPVCYLAGAPGQPDGRGWGMDEMAIPMPHGHDHIAYTLASGKQL